MNIVYLVGNGFDLNLGMETEYKHFFKYYLSNIGSNDSPHIKKFKDTLKKDKEKWSYLEEELGKYSKEMEKEEAIILHDHLIEHLSKYLASEEDKYSNFSNGQGVFWEYLQNPHMHGNLLQTEITEIANYIGDALHRGCKIILFEHNPKKIFNGNQGPHLKAAKETIKDEFLSKINFAEDTKITVKKDIYVALNTDMFKIDIGKKEEKEK